MQSLLLNAGRTSAKDIESIENVIINGDFQVAQQGVSFPSANTYTLDQWIFYNATGAAYTVTQGTDIPAVAQAGIHAGNSLTATCTTGAASFASGASIHIIQHIKGSRFRKIAQKNFVLSFWVSSSVPGTYCITFRNVGVDRLYIAEYTVSAANTWERKTIVVPASPSAGTWNYANGTGLSILWTLAGFANTGTANAWSSNTQNYTANQVNHAQINNTFKLALVKIEPGVVATPFPVRDSDLLLCQEYYCRLSLSECSYAAAAGDQLQTTVFLPTVMRAVPSVSLVTAGARANLADCAIYMHSAKEGRFVIAAAAAGGLYYTLGDIWEFSARL
jgi:hypothetical protein